MAQVLMISIFGQFSGNGLGYFNTVIYSNVSPSQHRLALCTDALRSWVSPLSSSNSVTT